MTRGDGRLSHDLLPGEKGPQDRCGVFGVWAPGEEVSKLTYFGLYALQHRGQEAAGIAVGDGSRILVYKDTGLVAQVFDESHLASLPGHLAVGHCRYSTAGASVWENAQPTFRSTATGSLALGHNGNLTNTDELARLVKERKSASGQLDFPGVEAINSMGATNDTDLLTALLASYPDLSVEAAAMEVLPQVRGAFCLVFMDESTLYAARDPQGIRPLVLGRLDRGWVIASETAALDIVGASFVREVEPGELIAIDEHGLRTQRFAAAAPKGCLFEYVYLARPDTKIAGRGVHAARVEIGRRLALEAPADADLVIPVPESGTPAAIGYAQGSGIPYGTGLVKNSYVGRTFIQPSQTIRQLGIRLKLNPLRDVIAGKRLVVVDDTIVRGNTQRAVIRMLREAGATEVHVRISSPPVKWPCFYGIDFASRAELIANGLGVEEVRASIGADSLAYISLAELVAATEQPADNLCRACFDGTYPVPIPPQAMIVPRLIPALNGHKRDAIDAEGVATGLPGGAADALTPSVTSYAAAGVDIAAGERAVELMRASVARTRRREVVGGIGGFAGMYDASALLHYRRPLLATSTDGVGTKVDIARRMDLHDTIGIDLVAMVVDDLVVCGAEPLFLTDYIACGKLVPERIAAIVAGVAEGCVRAGCALLGGETAEHPGLLVPDEYDLAGAGTGVVEADAVLGPERVRTGDAVVAMGSSGLHSNGYSLVRQVLAAQEHWQLDRHEEEMGRTLGQELLEPTRIYARECLTMTRELDVHAFSHVTGGGLAANLARVLPPQLSAVVDRATWTPAPIFAAVGSAGGVPDGELEATLNMGVGMVAVLPADQADAAVALLLGRGVPAWAAGEIRRGDGSATLTGKHPGWSPR